MTATFCRQSKSWERLHSRLSGIIIIFRGGICGFFGKPREERRLNRDSMKYCKRGGAVRIVVLLVKGGCGLDSLVELRKKRKSREGSGRREENIYGMCRVRACMLWCKLLGALIRAGVERVYCRLWPPKFLGGLWIFDLTCTRPGRICEDGFLNLGSEFPRLSGPVLKARCSRFALQP